MTPSSEAHPLAPLVTATVTAGTLLVAFSLLALGVESFWIAFVVGFGGVLPVSLGLLEHADRAEVGPSERGDGAEEDTALAALRREYARGEIGDATFERRLEQLLETESEREEPTRRRVEDPGRRP